MNCTKWDVKQINMMTKSPRRYISKKGLVLTTEWISLSSAIIQYGQYQAAQLSLAAQEYESVSDVSVTQETRKHGGQAELHSFSTLQH